MFLEHRVDVTSSIQENECNQLAIMFESALRHGRDRVRKYGDRVCWNGEASRLYVRKAQYHWGWDWGPTIISAGPWKPIYLEIYQSRIAEMEFSIVLSENLFMATIYYTFTLENPPDDAVLELELSSPNTSDQPVTVYQHQLAISGTQVKGTIPI